MNATTTKFFIYARKSTDDLSRQIRSIDDQIAELRDLARKEGLSVVDVLIEKQTAKVPGRPVFNAMLERIDRGEATGILAWHPDRLARNSLDGGQIIYRVDTKAITELKFPTFPFDPSASGKFMLSIMFGQSKYYVDNLSENIKRGQRQKLRNGIWPMVAPIGYLNDKMRKTIVPDPERSPLIRKAFELYAEGTYTIDRLVTAVNALGLVTRHGSALSRPQYHRMLQNPLYCGIIRYGDEDYEGKHEPLVSKALFDAVQRVMQRKSKPKTPTLKPYLYRGVFQCGECGCWITTETQKGHNYLRCTKRVKKDCSQPYVREEIIGNQITDYLQRLALSDADADWIMTKLEAEQDTDRSSRRECLDALRAKARQTNLKLDRLMDAYLDQTISLEEYRLAKAKLVEEKQELKDKLAVTEENRGNWFEPALSFVSTLTSTGFLAENGTEEEKLEFLKKVGSNLTISDRHLSVIPRQAWKLVVDQGHFAQHTTAPSSSGAAFVGETDHHLNQAERPGFDNGEIRKVLSALYLRLISSDGKDLARLVDVLKLHGFLWSYDAR